ncbi:MAG: UDP-glucose 4-epimerase GalE [Candidatus Solibacter usitatus]|nr:UDP-glucose 4-epimerase GalE [Candidatus Solibacter usitatus]
MRETDVRRIVFSSTCATYGMPEELPISETEPQTPVNPYGESKLFVEKTLHWYGRTHGFSWSALRYFNAAGADSEGELGECHDPETHLIPIAVQSAMGVRAPLRIMGTDYPTPDGTAIRDYVHVEDLASAHVKALEYLSGGGKNAAFNLGTARGYSVREAIAAVHRASGLRVPARECERRPGDPHTLVADNSRARKMLHWKPRYENLDEIVSTAWEWHASQSLAAAASSGN